MCGACVTELMVKTGVKQTSPSGVATMERCMQRPTLLLCSSIPAADYQDHYQPHIVRFILYIVRATCSAPAQLMEETRRAKCDVSRVTLSHARDTIDSILLSRWWRLPGLSDHHHLLQCRQQTTLPVFLTRDTDRPYQDLILSANIKYSNIEIMR